MAGIINNRLLLSILALSFTLASCDNEYPQTSVQGHRPGLAEQTARLEWLERKRQFMAPFLTSSDLPQKEIMEAFRDSLTSSRDEIMPSTKVAWMPSEENLIRYIAGLDFPDNQVTFFYSQYREATMRERSLISGGLGPNHPDIVKTQEQKRPPFAKPKGKPFPFRIFSF